MIKVMGMLKSGVKTGSLAGVYIQSIRPNLLQKAGDITTIPAEYENASPCLRLSQTTRRRTM